MNAVAALAALVLLAAPNAAPPARAEAGAVTLTPTTSQELTTGLSPLWLRKDDLASVDVETTATGVRAKLTWKSGKTGPSSIFTPVRPAKIADARKAIQAIATKGAPPTRGEANELFDMIDPAGR